MAGPRDWSPTDVAPPPKVPNRRVYHNTQSIKVRRWSAWICLLLGLAAAVIAFIPSHNGLTTNGFIFSGVGIIGIAFGIDAIRHRRVNRPGSTPIAVVGIVLGGVGTAIMIVQLTVFYLTAGSSGGTLGLLGSRPMFELPGASATQQPTASPSPSMVGDGDERATLVRVEGGLVHALTMTTPPGSSWPAAVTVAGDGQSVALQSGQIVGQVPPGTQVLYSRSSDGANYSLVLTGSTGVVVQYDTLSGAITTQ